MIKSLFIFILLTTYLFSSTAAIDKKIASNQKTLKKNNFKKDLANLKIKLLANQINKQSSELDKIEVKIDDINKEIDEHQEILEQSKKILENLTKTSDELLKERQKSEEDIVQIIIEEFSSSIALTLASEESLEELIDSEIYKILSQNSKDEILRINNNYTLINQNKKNNEKAIENTKIYIKSRERKKRTLSHLKHKQTKAIKSLENKHTLYQKELKTTIKKQQNLAELLGKLNILKKEELTKEKNRLIALKEKREREREARKREKETALNKTKTKEKTSKIAIQKYADDIDSDVRILGSSTSGVKIGKYRGNKTISPLKSYEIVKKFGTYYDPVYKIKLFNESIVLKSKEPKAKVFSVLNGKVVYAKKDSGMLENVVIIQHQDGLHTIYSHLDKISPTLRVGKWIKKGYVVGRIDETLTFQATKNSSHINPQDLF